MAGYRALLAGLTITPAAVMQFAAVYGGHFRPIKSDETPDDYNRMVATHVIANFITVHGGKIRDDQERK
jgi:hypothetical protein